MTTIPGTNSGHGHVFLRPDGVVARCGGPALCPECAKDYVHFHSIAPPPRSHGTDIPPISNSAAPASTMTKRELIAAMAMQGLLGDAAGTGAIVDYAEAAVEFADALLKELET